MAGPLSNPFMFKSSGGAAAAAFYPHQIANSFRWDSGYLKFTPSSAGNRQTWTFSCWMKQSGTILNDQGDMAILNAGTSGHHADRFRMYFHTQQLRSSSNEANYNVSANLYRDPSAWMHIVWKLTGGVSYQYVNGVLITNESVSGNVAINNAVEHTMGVYGGYATASRFKGYLAEVVFIDGTALNPTSFASEKNGCWVPDEIDLTFGSQGYHLNFANASAPGNDVSGNNNDWTNVSLATHDQMLDTPTFGSDSGGNFCTLNPLSPTTNGAVYTEGNLKVSPASNWSSTTYIKGNMHIPKDKKIYFEASDAGSNGGLFAVGIARESGVPSGTNVGGAGSVTLYDDSKYVNGTQTSSFITQASAGDIVQVAVDGATGKVWLGINNTWGGSGDPAAGSNQAGIVTSFATEHLFPVVAQNSASNLVMNFGQDSSFAGAKTAQGNGGDNEDFTYTPPTNFVALSTANLTVADAIDPAQTDDNYPQKLFNATLYTGTGSSNAITGVGFKPDWSWIKERNGTSDHQVTDSTRGVTKFIETNTTANQATDTNGLTAFGSDGFTVGSSAHYNTNNDTYVGWSWRAKGGTTSTNDEGDVDTTIQVDPSTGFSIVQYTGSLSSSGAVHLGHGLSKAPSAVITKTTGGSNAGNWWFLSDSQDSWNYGMNLNSTAAQTDKSGNGSMASPTSTVFDVNYTDGMNETGDLGIAYCFANIEGYIKEGKYVGNANADGTFVYTGFSPAWILVKEFGASDNWLVYDNKRLGYNKSSAGNAILYIDTTSAEENQASRALDILSNGFKIRTSNATLNADAGKYQYLAFSHNPFKYSLAR